MSETLLAGREVNPKVMRAARDARWLSEQYGVAWLVRLGDRWQGLHEEGLRYAQVHANVPVCVVGRYDNGAVTTVTLTDAETA